MIIDTIGIDIDVKNPKTLRKYEERMKSKGVMIDKYKTPHGYHYRVKLIKRFNIRGLKTWVEIFLLRAWLGDDPRRIIFDLNKVFHGFEIVDILFTKKWRGKMD